MVGRKQGIAESSSGIRSAVFMETREVLLKADKVTLTFERTAESKIRVTTTSWDDAKVILPNQALEAAIIGKQVGLVRVDKPIAYLDIDETSLLLRICDA